MNTTSLELSRKLDDAGFSKVCPPTRFGYRNDQGRVSSYPRWTLDDLACQYYEKREEGE